MSYFNYNGHSIYYQELGSGEPLFLLHGNTASSAMFSQIAPQYAQDYNVFLIDFLGCGKSDRVDKMAEDLWYDEAMQVISLIEEKQLKKVNIIGTSGGALAALNIALERPDIVATLIADSFEGEYALPEITENLRQGREASKKEADAVMFYKAMNGEDWELVVDSDTEAVLAHAKHIGVFFHKPFSTLKPPVLFSGSNEDPFAPSGYFEELFSGLCKKAGHGQKYIFEHGGHPAMLTNQAEFVQISKEFIAGCRR